MLKGWHVDCRLPGTLWPGQWLHVFISWSGLTRLGCYPTDLRFERRPQGQDGTWHQDTNYTLGGNGPHIKLPERERERMINIGVSRMSRTGTDHPGNITADLYIGKLKNPFQSLCLSRKTCKVIIFKMSFSTDWPLCVEVSTRLAVMLLLLSPLLNTVYLLCH